MAYITDIDGTEMIPVMLDNVKGTYIQWMLDDRTGAHNFALRRFLIKEGGEVGLHTHPWEHELFILSGNGYVLRERETIPVGPGSAIYIEPSSLHGFRNAGAEDFIFLCIVPKAGFRPQ